MKQFVPNFINNLKIHKNLKYEKHINDILNTLEQNDVIILDFDTINSKKTECSDTSLYEKHVVEYKTHTKYIVKNCEKIPNFSDLTEIELCEQFTQITKYINAYTIVSDGTIRHTESGKIHAYIKNVEIIAKYNKNNEKKQIYNNNFNQMTDIIINKCAWLQQQKLIIRQQNLLKDIFQKINDFNKLDDDVKKFMNATNTL